jgi:MarR family 2-MHQ and catechol resistance regulon transcriptional repressor
MNNSVVFPLIHVAHALEDQFDEALATVDLSSPKFSALAVMVAEGKPISLGELAAKLTCVRSNITQLVDRLEKDGYVKRTDDPSDRRGVRAEVTALGKERFEAGAQATSKIHEAVANKLSATDQVALLHLLNTLS